LDPQLILQLISQLGPQSIPCELLQHRLFDSSHLVADLSLQVSWLEVVTDPQVYAGHLPQVMGTLST
jgi:hypothetical protein